MNKRGRLCLLVTILCTLGWSDLARAVNLCLISPFYCVSDVFKITDSAGNVVNDINGTPVNYTLYEAAVVGGNLTDGTIHIQMHVGSLISDFTGTVYLTEGPPSPTGLTQVSDSIVSYTYIDSDQITLDAFVTFASDTEAAPLGYVDCSVNNCVQETGQLQDLTSLFATQFTGLHIFVQSDVSAAAEPGIVWTHAATNTIGGAKIDGTFLDTDYITEGSATPGYGVAFDSTYIYWANPSSNAIGRSARDRSSVSQSFIPGATSPSGVAVDGSFIYWANTGTNTIGRANLDGTGANQSFITGATSPVGVVADGTYVYWANGNGTIGRANSNGTGVTQSFITGAQNPYGVAVDTTYLYWTNYATNSIGRANRNGTGVNQSFITGASSPGGVAVDWSFIYWANAGGTTIGRANLDGSAVNPSFIASGASLDVAVLSRAVDYDGDGIPDLSDNCPYTANPDQTDSGGVGTGSSPDGIGDVCQCGDVDNDGVVTNNDATLIRRAVAGLAPYTGGVTTLPGATKCDVNVSGTCNNTDAVIIQRAVAGLGPGVKQGCTASVPH